MTLLLKLKAFRLDIWHAVGIAKNGAKGDSFLLENKTTPVGTRPDVTPITLEMH